MKAYRLDPQRELLYRFNAAERDRLLPRWRRARARLVLGSIPVVLLAAWFLAVVLAVRP